MLSLTVHVAIARHLSKKESYRKPAEQGRALELAILQGLPAAPTPPATSAQPAAPAVASTPTQRSRPESAPRRVPSRASEAHPAAPPLSVSNPATAEGPSWHSLSPRAAALTGLSELLTEAGSDRRTSTVSAEDKLERAIMAGAERHVDRPPEPRLLPRAEGGYDYKGNGFDAVIAPDGALTMKDRFGAVVLPLVPYRNRDGKWRVSPFLGGSFSLYAWLDRKFGKNDPYASERRWFLEHTRDLREELWRKRAPSMKHARDAGAG